MRPRLAYIIKLILNVVLNLRKCLFQNDKIVHCIWCNSSYLGTLRHSLLSFNEFDTKN